jgi:hypothetical protein
LEIFQFSDNFPVLSDKLLRKIGFFNVKTPFHPLDFLFFKSLVVAVILPLLVRKKY